MLERFPHALVYSTALSAAGGRTFEELLGEYRRYHGQHAHRVHPIRGGTRIDADLFYTLFLNNAFGFLPVIEQSGLPFVFTLYPGGGFQLGQPESDAKLRAVCALPNLRKIITTQNVTQRYLIENNFCPASKTEFIYGGVLPSNALQATTTERTRYQVGKSSFDICFVAAKYMPQGRDRVSDRLLRRSQPVRRCRSLFRSARTKRRLQGRTRNCDRAPRRPGDFASAFRPFTNNRTRCSSSPSGGRRP